jgi:hypothetical protein
VKLIPIIMAVFSLSALLSDCGGPDITANNNTTFGVRVILHTTAGPDVLSPSPGESSSADAVEGGFTATAINDQDWINYAKVQRKLLDDQLTNAGTLTGPQLLTLLQRLKDIAAKMDAYQAAAGKGATCEGTITQNADGVITIGQAADGSLAVTCGTTGGSGSGSSSGYPSSNP